MLGVAWGQPRTPKNFSVLPPCLCASALRGLVFYWVANVHLFTGRIYSEILLHAALHTAKRSARFKFTTHVNTIRKNSPYGIRYRLANLAALLPSWHFHSRTTARLLLGLPRDSGRFGHHKINVPS
jgi:hypothetical protein